MNGALLYTPSTVTLLRSGRVRGDLHPKQRNKKRLEWQLGHLNCVSESIGGGAAPLWGKVHRLTDWRLECAATALAAPRGRPLTPDPDAVPRANPKRPPNSQNPAACSIFHPLEKRPPGVTLTPDTGTEKVSIWAHMGRAATGPIIQSGGPSATGVVMAAVSSAAARTTTNGGGSGAAAGGRSMRRSKTSSCSLSCALNSTRTATAQLITNQNTKMGAVF